ncbi:mismatch repair endonuclease PMS2-like [Styela clava]
MATIRAIGRETVHQICSGQVILDLATAVKELLENSVDAGADSIEIKLKDYGRTCIEVTDNGKGVEENDYESLTLKHHTSKLQNFSDLLSVETFGFRGEALSSLCSLCSLSITTRCKSAKIAHKLVYNNNGGIMKKSCVARQLGTTVVLKDLFCTLPVRHKEFVKNIKREFSKLINLLNAYCLIYTNVRISCINETSKGNRSVILITSGKGSILDNISALFGSKQHSTLLEFKQIPPSPEVCGKYFVNHDKAIEFFNQCKVSGYISSCAMSLGRNASDRQYYSINKRPCVIPKIMKVVNEVFHMFNRYQYPFVQLDISTKSDEVDVNVTPDKRKIFIQQEKYILAIIRTSLLELFNGKDHAIGVTKAISNNANILAHTVEKNISIDEAIDDIKSKPYDFQLVKSEPYEKIQNCRKINVKRPFLHTSTNYETDLIPLLSSNKRLKQDQNSNKNYEESHKHFQADSIPTYAENREVKDKIPPKEPSFKKFHTAIDDPADKSTKIQCHLRYSFAVMCNNMKAKFIHLSRSSDESRKKLHPVFKAKISSDQNKKAEAELVKYFNKSSFENMEIIGQFNMGFIIGKHRNDLFIIDQHAADEKYNFEELQSSTILLGQPLIIPQLLELTAGEQLIVIENAEIFQKNGFVFNIASNNDTQDTMYLTKVPMSRNWTFGASDVSELIFMLTDTPHTNCRPSRVRQMFASRACRKSIMVGTALTENQMKDVVSHMAKMNQPWNCPHGRPTMRHLTDLSMLVKPGNS